MRAALDRDRNLTGRVQSVARNHTAPCVVDRAQAVGAGGSGPGPPLSVSRGFSGGATGAARIVFGLHRWGEGKDEINTT